MEKIQKNSKEDMLSNDVKITTSKEAILMTAGKIDVNENAVKELRKNSII